MFNIRIYNEASGKKPFIEWFDDLPTKTQQGIDARLVRVEAGNLGDYKSVGKGVSELRFYFESGYRVYFAREGQEVILLLSAGNKSSQKHDIKKAQGFWEDYLDRKDSLCVVQNSVLRCFWQLLA